MRKRILFVKNPTEDYVSRKWKTGETYVGRRKGSVSDFAKGKLLRSYFTLNDGYKNPAHVLLCEDGKKRSFQFLQTVDDAKV